MTGWQPPLVVADRLIGIHKREVMQMTDYEIIMIVIEIIGLSISSCTLLLVLLAFLDKKKKDK